MKKIITIGREYGAGGHSIGTKVAEELGIPFYDKDILRETAKASGYEPELIASESEEISKKDSFWKNLAQFSNAYYQDTQDAIWEIQKTIILHLAQKGPCVILGRCADVILREAGIETLDVFIHADDVHRAVRLSQQTGSSNATELQKMMEKKDASRHNYYTRYTGKKWGDSHNYHLTLDSGALGDDLCVHMIMELAKAAD